VRISITEFEKISSDPANFWKNLSYLFKIQ
jgi:hypothetical protein